MPRPAPASATGIGAVHPGASLPVPPASDPALRDDIRLLGRILGEVIREQEGRDVYARVEAIRRACVRFASKGEVRDRRRIDALLAELDDDTMLRVVRAFAYFLQLVNVAEDVWAVRQSRATREAAGPDAPPPAGTLAATLAALPTARGGAGRAANDRLQRLLEVAEITPVITAHPTEVRRQSTQRALRAISRLLQERDRLDDGALDADARLAEIRRHVLTLWNTRLVRPSRLRVLDEVKNGIHAFTGTFLGQVPALHQRLEALLRRRAPRRQWTVPTLLRIGSWIGGDRDGNPFVTDEILAGAFRLQAAAALRHHLAEVDALGLELSISSTRVGPPPAALASLSDASPDPSTHRRDEPYRRALIGVYARLAATMRTLTDESPARPPVADAAPYAAPDDFAAELATIREALVAQGLAPLAEGRLARLERAVSVFGFHLAAVDLRQNAAVHERVVAELLAAAGVEPAYRERTEAERIACLTELLRGTRPVRAPWHAYSTRRPASSRFSTRRRPSTAASGRRRSGST